MSFVIECVILAPFVIEQLLVQKHKNLKFENSAIKNAINNIYIAINKYFVILYTSLCFLAGHKTSYTHPGSAAPVCAAPGSTAQESASPKVIEQLVVRNISEIKMLIIVLLIMLLIMLFKMQKTNILVILFTSLYFRPASRKKKVACAAICARI